MVDADSLAIAKERLRRDSVMVTHLAQMQKRQRKSDLDGNMLLNFTRELGQLLSAGLPLMNRSLLSRRNTAAIAFIHFFLISATALKAATSSPRSCSATLKALTPSTFLWCRRARPPDRSLGCLSSYISSLKGDKNSKSS